MIINITNFWPRAVTNDNVSGAGPSLSDLHTISLPSLPIEDNSICTHSKLDANIWK